MEPEITGAYIGAGASLAVGIIGIFFASIANSRAKKANDIAQTANDIAANALTKAAEANQIAEDANKLSADANSLVSREAEQRTEQHITEWALDIHEERSPIIRLRQLGRDTAHRVSIGIRGKNVYEIRDGYSDCPLGSELEITLPQAVQDQLGKFRTSGFIGDRRTVTPVVQKLTVEIHWFTALGNPREKHLEIKVK